MAGCCNSRTRSSPSPRALSGPAGSGSCGSTCSRTPWGSIIINLMFTIPAAIFAEAFLSFIGLGIQVPEASLGSLISDGAARCRFHPYLSVVPGRGLLPADGLLQPAGRRPARRPRPEDAQVDGWTMNGDNILRGQGPSDLLQHLRRRGPGRTGRQLRPQAGRDPRHSRRVRARESRLRPRASCASTRGQHHREGRRDPLRGTRTC